MFSFFKKKASFDFDYSMLVTDMHSHLLPGIDDGAPDMSVSLQLIRGLAELGFKKFYTTPHIMWDMYPNTREDILVRIVELRNTVKENNINIDVNAAAEYYIDEHFRQLLDEKKPLLTIDKNMVLVEFSLASPPLELKEVLFEMQLQGYQPIIAHPERYLYLEHSKHFYDELKDFGCLFQLNLLSLGGFYGRAVQDFSQYLAKKEYYNLVGTDMHHLRHLQGLQDVKLYEGMQRILDSGTIRNANL
ncbi:MAG: histidinol phosphatase [Chitinophagaceae bacterium]|jgi:tyrosine-protein phosphatase YwqE|nr:histidinol phosphatase [Chitinophagaceae bacterium]